jgi:hypothetical protein
MKKLFPFILILCLCSPPISLQSPSDDSLMVKLENYQKQKSANDSLMKVLEKNGH